MIKQYRNPIIGILSTSFNKNALVKPVGIQAELASLTSYGNKLKATVFVFAPQDVDWCRKEVTGYKFAAKEEGYGRWEAGRYPLPYVVYDQMFKTKNNSYYKTVSKKLKQLTGGRYFNARYFNKMMVYNNLSKIPELAKYLPNTRRLASRADLAGILKYYRKAYVKPVSGSMGHRIIKIDKVNNSYQYQTWGGRKGTARSIKELYRSVIKLTRGRKCLVQAGIDLIRYKGNLVDIRVLMQKNSKGEWTITKMYARAARPGQITSNLATGGIAYPLTTVLSVRYDNNQIQHIKKEIRALAYQACRGLEEVSGRRMGELGVDVGLDRSGRLWLIELNCKPRRATDTTGNPRLVELSFIKPLRYAEYLAGSSPEKHVIL